MSKTPRAPFSAHFGSNPPSMLTRKFFLSAKAAGRYVREHATRKTKIAVLCATFYSGLRVKHRPVHVFKIR